MTMKYAYEDVQDIPVKNEMSYQFIFDNLKELEGRMLTVAEATVDKDKQKATKDIIRDAFSVKYNWLFEYCHVVDLEENKDD